MLSQKDNKGLETEELVEKICTSCSAATLNPQIFQNMVAFYARKGEEWYYVEIGVFGE